MPRKPRQQRSRATVEAIVEAGFRCVQRHGSAGTTTRHIADTAGIGVGSLYEYFENKEAVFDAMNRRFVDDIAVLIREITPEVMQQDVHGAVETLFRHFGDFLVRDDSRYLAFARQLMQVDTGEYVEPVIRALQDLVVQYLMKHPELTRLRNIPTMGYIFINAGIFVVLRHLSSDKPPVSFAEVGRGLADLVSFYVAHDLAQVAPAAPKRRGRKR